MLSADQKPKPSETPSSKVTQAELDALGIDTSRLVDGGVDRYFKWRHAFLACIVLGSLIRLQFYADQTLNLAVIFNDMGIDTHAYVSFRSAYLVSGFVLYTVSYLCDWYFPKIALFSFTLELGGFFTDALNFLIFYQNVFTPAIYVAFAIRIFALVLMFCNAINSHRAPAIPRRFWS